MDFPTSNLFVLSSSHSFWWHSIHVERCEEEKRQKLWDYGNFTQLICALLQLQRKDYLQGEDKCWELKKNLSWTIRITKETKEIIFYCDFFFCFENFSSLFDPLSVWEEETNRFFLLHVKSTTTLTVDVDSDNNDELRKSIRGRRKRFGVEMKWNWGILLSAFSFSSTRLSLLVDWGYICEQRQQAIHSKEDFFFRSNRISIESTHFIDPLLLTSLHSSIENLFYCLDCVHFFESLYFL